MDLIEEQEKIAAKKFQEQQKADRLKTRKETIIEKCKYLFLPRLHTFKYS
jgi:hypothetical protein